MPTHKNVKLNELTVWDDNPRGEPQENELNEMLYLVNTYNEKLVNIAKDIINNGILENIAIYNFENKKYVYDGNRRITAMKLMDNPEIIKNHNPTYYKKFAKLVLPEIVKNTIPAIEYEFHEKKEIYEILQRRHTGQLNGVGTIPWGAIEKERFNKMLGIKTPLLDILDYLLKEKYLTLKQINDVTQTNWARILNGKLGQTYLKCTVIENKLIVNDKNKDHFIKRLNIIAKKLENKTVKIVYDNEAIKTLFNKIDEEYFKEDTVNEQQSLNLTITPSNLSNTHKNNYNNDYLEKNETKPNLEQEEKIERTPNKQNIFLSNIKNNIDKNNSENQGICLLLDELEKLSSTNYYKKVPMATAMLMRCTLEQVLIYFLKQHNLWDKFSKGLNNGNPTLQQILNKYEKDDYSIIRDKGDNNLLRLYKSFTNNNGTKDYFDMIVHHPDKISANFNCLEVICESGYRSLLEYILTNYI